MKFLIRLFASLATTVVALATSPRTTLELAAGWRSIAAETGTPMPTGALTPAFDDSAWTPVEVPHNWDRYEGFRQLKHGDRHGSAWYRRRFELDESARERRVFLFFEGVGSYATVWVNGEEVGRHAGGLTTFTLDVTDAVKVGAENLLVVQADHPVGIRDLPWVCGGSERAYGFSEGTQPFGIFRPVHLVVTDAVRVEPFGVHVWNDDSATADAATVHLRTEIRNASPVSRTVKVVSTLHDRDGTQVAEQFAEITLPAGRTSTWAAEPFALRSPRLWSLQDPHLYTVTTSIHADDRLLDQTRDTFGVRTVRWPRADEADGRFFLNGEPVFLNGTCDYEHLLGASHAFGAEQIDARVNMMEAAGYNAFRDAHHPHNLRFNQRWDADGLLWWTQFGAHCWFDNDAFRANFKILLREWVRERRNSPSLVLWGLQNESHVPADFAAECTAIIRELDPTSPSQRLVTTCNGGEGTDWDVPQNWTGTYGGDPATYADDLRKHRLFGEYGAWRSLGLHDEAGYDLEGPLSEERMTTLMQTKVRLGEVAGAESAGHFHWPFTTHMNPGRHFGSNGEQLYDGIRPLDQVGPANNKGLTTIWGEPADAFYMFRSHFADPVEDPMVYIPLHTWPGRWTEPGTKDAIVIYSNCDEVELFNDLDAQSLGTRTRGERGVPFRWDDVPVRYNMLYAEGRIDGKVVARDLVHLHHLPLAPGFAAAQSAALAAPDTVSPTPGANVLYRVNCGGPDYTDPFGKRWLADREWTPGDSWGSFSWAQAYDNLPPRFGSQRKTHDPIAGTAADPLYQTFRYGRDELGWRFRLPEGDYAVDLHFVEPWYGTGGGDATGWRLFDVAINDRTVIPQLDLWATAGHDHAVVKTVAVRVDKTGLLTIRFPRVSAGQAVISAIAIRSHDIALATAELPPPPVEAYDELNLGLSLRGGLDEGDRLAPATASPATFAHLPPALLEADWLPPAAAQRVRSLRFRTATDVYSTEPSPGATKVDTTFSLANPASGPVSLWRNRVNAGDTLALAQGSNGPLFFVPRRAPAAPQFIQLNPASGDAWQALGHLQRGASLVGESTMELAKLPQNLSDADLVRPRSLSANGPLALVALDHLEVHAVPLAARTPSWFAAWQDNRARVDLADGTVIALRRTRLDPGQSLALPPEADAPFALILRAVRPAITITAQETQLGGNAALSVASDESGYTSIRLPREASSRVEWPLLLGAGDRYGLVFAFRHDSGSPVEGTLLILDRQGNELRRDPISFPSRTTNASADWQHLITRTGRSLNAGNYRLRLELIATESLELGTLIVE